MPVSGKLAIRFARHGCTNRPFYHLVVMKQHKGRNSTPIEQLGTFDPLHNEHNERLVAVNFERLKHWLSVGANPTLPVLKLLGLSGFFPIHPMTFVTAQRNRASLAAKNDQLADQENNIEQSVDVEATATS